MKKRLNQRGETCRSTLSGKKRFALALAVSLWIANGGVASAQETTVASNYTGDVYGNHTGDDLSNNSGNPNNNTVTVNEGVTVSKGVYGSLGTEDADAEGNKVIINGTVTGYVYGGKSGHDAEANSNMVTINGEVKASVYGGTGTFEHYRANGNMVTIKGTAWKDVYGGLGEESATGNSVTVIDGTVKKDVYGGYINYNADATSNQVTLSGATVEGNVYGGYTRDFHEFGNKTINNQVTLNGATVGGNVYGGFSERTGDVTTGNTLYLFGASTAGDTVGNFEKIVLQDSLDREYADGTQVKTATYSLAWQDGAALLSAKEFKNCGTLDISAATNLKNATPGTMTLLSAPTKNNAFDGMPLKYFDGGTATLSTEGTQVFSGAASNAKNGVTLSYDATHTVKLANVNENTKNAVTYNVAAAPVATVTLGTVAWSAGGTARDAGGDGFTFNGSTAIDATNLSFVDESGAAYTPEVGGSMTLLSAGNNLSGLKLAYDAATQETPVTLTEAGVAFNTRELVDGNENKFYSNEGKAALTNENKAVTYTAGTPHIALTDRTGTAGAVTLYAQPAVSDAEAGYAVGSDKLYLANDFKSLTVENGTWTTIGLYGGYTETGDVKGYSLTVTGGTVKGDIYGGKSGSGAATYNNVSIKGATVTGNVYGGYTDSGTGDVTGNIVTLDGATVTGDLYGGGTNTGTGDVVTGNTLELSGVGNIVGGNIYNLETVKLKNTTACDPTMLSVTGDKDQRTFDNGDGKTPPVIDASELMITNPEYIGSDAQTALIIATKPMNASLKDNGLLPIQDYSVTPVEGVTVDAELHGRLFFNYDKTRLIYQADNWATKLTFGADIPWNTEKPLYTKSEQFAFEETTVDVSGLTFSNPEPGTMTLLSSGDAMEDMKLAYDEATKKKPVALTAEGVTVGTYKVADGSDDKFYKGLKTVSLADENKAVAYTFGDYLSYTDRTGTAGAVTLYAQPSASDTEAGYTVNNNNLRLADGFKALTVADGTWDTLQNIYAGYSTTGADLTDYALTVKGGTFIAHDPSLRGAYGNNTDTESKRMSGNTVNIDGGSIAGNNVNLCGGYIGGGSWTTGDTPNAVNISGGTLTSNNSIHIYGTYNASAGAIVTGGAVNITGGVLSAVAQGDAILIAGIGNSESASSGGAVSISGAWDNANNAPTTQLLATGNYSAINIWATNTNTVYLGSEATGGSVTLSGHVGFQGPYVNLYGRESSATGTGNTLHIGTEQDAWRGYEKSDSGWSLTNRVYSVNNFDTVALHKVEYGDTPALQTEHLYYSSGRSESDPGNVTLDLTNLSFEKGGKAYTPEAGDSMTLLSAGSDLTGLKVAYDAATQTKSVPLTAEGVAVQIGEDQTGIENGVCWKWNEGHVVSMGSDGKSVGYEANHYYSDFHFGDPLTWKKDGTAAAVTDPHAVFYGVQANDDGTTTFTPTTVDLKDLTRFEFVETRGDEAVIASGDTMTLLSMEGLPTSTELKNNHLVGIEAFHTGANGVKLDANAVVDVTVEAGAVKGALKELNFGSVDLSGWDGTTEAVPAAWADQVDVSVRGSVENPGLAAGDAKDILTGGSTGMFRDVWIDPSIRYAENAFKDSEAKGVTLSGLTTGGVKATQDGKALTYYAEAQSVETISFGEMKWDDGRAVDTKAGFDFRSVGKIDAGKLSFAFTNEQAAALSKDSRMTLLSDAANLKAGAAVTEANRRQEIAYRAANGGLLTGTLTGTVTTAEGQVNYQATGVTLDSVGLGAYEWQGDADTAPTGWTASGATAVDTTKLTVAFTDAQKSTLKAGDAMTLLSATGLTGADAVETPAALASFAVAADGVNGAAFVATAGGKVSAAAGAVDYAITGVAVDSVTVGTFDWTGGANTAPTGWTISGATNIDLSDLAVTNNNGAKPGDTATILTAAGYEFTADQITGLGGGGAYVDAPTGGVTLAGEIEGGGASIGAQKNTIVYEMPIHKINAITLGTVAFDAKTPARDAGGAVYDYAGVTSLGTKDFSVSYAKPESVAAGDAMTVLQANGTLKDISAPAATTTDYEITTGGVTVSGAITGSAAAKNGAVQYAVTSNQANKLTFAAVDWMATGALIDHKTALTNISFDGADVDAARISFGNVNVLNTGDKMTLVSDFGTAAGTITGGSFVVGGKKGGGNAYFESGDLLYLVTQGTADKSTDPDDAIDEGGTPVENQTIEGDVTGGVAKNDGVAELNEKDVTKSTVKGDVTAAQSNRGEASGNTAAVKDSKIGGSVTAAVSTGGGVVAGNRAGVEGGSVGKDVTGASTQKDGSAAENSAQVTGGSVGGSVTGATTAQGVATANTAQVTGGSVGGDVTGAKSESGTVSNGNRATVTDAKIGGNVYGGLSETGEVNTNRAEVFGGSVGQSVIGGKTVGGKAESNTAEVAKGAKVKGGVLGAATAQGEATDNTATVTDGSVVTGNVAGAVSQTGAVRQNTANITGGTVNGIVAGAATEKALADGNTANITGGTVTGNVLGADTLGGNVSGNTANVKDSSTVNGDILGAETESGDASANHVVVSDSTVNALIDEKGEIEFYGDVFGAETETGVASGNTATVTNSVIAGDVLGGLSDQAEANKNEAHVSGGAVGGVYGGYSYNGSVDGNIATVDSGAVINAEVYGGGAEAGDASGNKAVVIGSTVNGDEEERYGDVIGGMTLDGAASGNKATVTDSVIAGSVYGGYSAEGTAHDNEVEISGKTEVNGTVYGGKSTDASNNNTVAMTGGTVGAIVGGGCDTATGNKVTIEDGEVLNGVYGAKAGTSATNNQVIMSGGTVGGVLYGGYAEDEAKNAGTTTGNIITLYGDADVSNANIYGGNGADVTGNTLVIGLKDSDVLSNSKAWTGGEVKNLANLETVRLDVVEWGKTALTITDGSETDLSRTTINAKNVHFKNADTLPTDKAMTLLDDSNVAEENRAKAVEVGTFTADSTLQGTGSFALDKNGNIVYKVDSVTSSDQSHNAVMGMSAGMAALSAGNDFIGSATEGLSLTSNTGADGVSSFAKLGGGSMRQETGSHVDTHTWNAILALGHQNKKEKSTTEYGAFFEYGSGNYSTFNDADQRGDGSMNYTGGGLLAKWTAKHGFYVEGSLRAGTVHDDARNVLRDYDGRPYSYETNANYFGAHLGVGKEITLPNGNTVDVYGKYFFNRKNGVSFNAGGHYDLDAVTSQILRVGARYTVKRDKWDFYVGAAYEHELDGKATGTADGLAIQSADPSGGSFRGEIGATMKPGENSPWQLDLNVAGFAGKKQGFTGGISVAFLF